MIEVALPESARQPSEALPVRLDGGPHLVERLREAEALLVHGFVDDGNARRLRQGDDEGLLPIGHEPRMHVGLKRHGAQLAAGMPEADAFVLHVELSADLAKDVEEARHRLLLGPPDENVAPGGKRGARPRARLDAVGKRGVRISAQFVDPLDANRAVGVHGDDRAHLLQDGDEVHDLRLNRGIRQLGDALGHDRRQKGLLRRPDGRVRQVHRLCLERLFRYKVHACGLLDPAGSEILEHPEVEVHGPGSDVAAAEVGDERLSEAVQKGAGEKDGNARRAGERVHLHRVFGQVDRARRHCQDAGLLVVVDGHPVHAQQIRDDVDVANQRHVAELRLLRREQGGHHRLRDQILRSAHGDLTAKWRASQHANLADHMRPPMSTAADKVCVYWIGSQSAHSRIAAYGREVDSPSVNPPACLCAARVCAVRKASADGAGGLHAVRRAGRPGPPAAPRPPRPPGGASWAASSA